MTCRFANQVIVVQKVLDIQKVETLWNFVDVLAKELSFSNVNAFIAKTFLSNKSFLTNESIKTLINVIDNDETTTNVAGSTLCKLSQNVIESIGSYLDINSSLKWSTCNRRMHKKVLNRNYFFSHPCTKTLRLTQNKLKKIVQ